jgi:hypothetical protein
MYFCRVPPLTIRPYSDLLLQQKVVAGNVFAGVTVRQAHDGVYIKWDFTSSSYPVACLNPYIDFRYEVRDNGGRVVLPDEYRLRHPPELILIANHAIPGEQNLDCRSSGLHEFRGYARSDTLYPKLQRGTYTLLMTFAPHGTARRAQFAPVKFVIK